MRCCRESSPLRRRRGAAALPPSTPRSAAMLLLQAAIRGVMSTATMLELRLVYTLGVSALKARQEEKGQWQVAEQRGDGGHSKCTNWK